MVRHSKAIIAVMAALMTITGCGSSQTPSSLAQNPTQDMTQSPTQEPTQSSAQKQTQAVTEASTQKTAAVSPEVQTEPTTEKATKTPTEQTVWQPVSSVKSAAAGEIITFGTYEQDGNTGNGAEPIEWLVLDNQGDKMLVISRYGLDCKKYNETYTEVTWETCTLRSWLNSEFYNTVFSESEKASILMTTLDNPDNAEHGTSGGNATEDRVFCLSINESQRYFGADDNNYGENKARATIPTQYAVSRGAETSSELYGGWWLRSSGYGQDDAAEVHYDGVVYLYGSGVDDASRSVRPALWIGF